MRRKAVFIPRESLLTKWFDTAGGRYLLGGYIALSTYYLVYKVVNYFLEHPSKDSSWNQDWGLVSSAFEGIFHCFGVWIVYHIILISVVYPLVSTFGHLKFPMTLLVIMTFIIIMPSAGYLAVGVFETGAATRIAISFESVRLCMKVLSFVIEVYDLKTRTKKIGDKEKESDEETTVPINTMNSNQDSVEEVSSVGHFIYFLFAPTGVYAPSYPRTERTNWSRFFTLHYINFTIILWGIKVVQESVCKFNQVGFKPIPLTMLYRSVLLDFPIYLIYQTTVLAIGAQHNWLNIWAELLRFADREFYLDYWTTASFSEHLLKWNKIMQNYLYYTIYNPLKSLIKNRKCAQIITMLWSGFFFHEFVLWMVLGFQFLVPAYSFAMFPMLNKSKPSETTPTLAQAVSYLAGIAGSGLLFGCVSIEYYSRFNCVIPEGRSIVADRFIPRSFSCVSFDWNS